MGWGGCMGPFCLESPALVNYFLLFVNVCYCLMHKNAAQCVYCGLLPLFSLIIPTKVDVHFFKSPKPIRKFADKLDWRLSRAANDMIGISGYASPAWADYAAPRPQRGKASASQETSVPDLPSQTAKPAKDAGDPSAPQLDPAEQEEVNKLQARDREVRAHEAAHTAAAGSLAVGGASFTYQQGPDGRMYAVGGEVHLSVSSGKTPAESKARAQQMRAAALAPADPSSQDMAVASKASSLELEAAKESQDSTGQAAAQAFKGKLAVYAYPGHDGDKPVLNGLA
jgi:hypothetical protein